MSGDITAAIVVQPPIDLGGLTIEGVIFGNFIGPDTYDSFWATITDNAEAPVYEFDGDNGISADADEVNDVDDIAEGTRVRVFGFAGLDGPYAFEYAGTGETTIEGGQGIVVDTNPVTTDQRVAVELSSNPNFPGLRFVGLGDDDDTLAVLLKADMGLLVDANGIYVEANGTAGIEVDGDGVAVKIIETVGGLKWNSGSIDHNTPNPEATTVTGAITGFSGENLAVSGTPNLRYDQNGHFILIDTATLTHHTHGAEIGSTGLDANGHVVAASHVVPSGTTAGDILYWSGTAWIKLAAPGAGSFVLYCTNNVPHWVS
jgi:hypothetical protein